MQAVVVYESLWGNTAALARAVSAGLGLEARAIPIAEATLDLVSTADLLVLGAPVHSYGLPEFVAIQAGRESAADTAPAKGLHLMRDWVANLPSTVPPIAVFEIRIENLPGEGGAREVLEALGACGHAPVEPAETFRMERLPIGFGPGGWIGSEELERARQWGSHLAETIAGSSS